MPISPRETHMRDLLSAYALGSLDADEARQVSEHLQTCGECHQEYMVYRAVVDRLSYAAPVMRPSPAIKDRLISRLDAKRSPRTPAELAIPLWKRLSPRGSGLMWAASVAMIVLLILSNIWLAGKISQGTTAGVATPSLGMLSEEGLITIALKHTDVAPHARGTLIVSVDGKHGVLVVDGLPTISARKVFQAWLGKLEQPINVGILTVNDRGYGWIEIAALEFPLSKISYFGITVEPEGGSSSPTGDHVLAMFR